MTSTPFMQLYIADYLGDTLHLTTEQHGAYLLILMAMWRADGRLPNDPAKLARIARVSPRRWHILADDVMAFFDVDGNEITQKRLVEERQKAASISEKRSVSGKLGGNAKTLKNKDTTLANAKQMPQHSQIPEPYKSSDANASSSPEPEKSAPVAVVGLPTVSDGDFQIFEADISEWQAAFPGVDVRQQLASMRQWLIANPTRRKTAKGMKRFVVSWLDRKQNEGPRTAARATSPPRKRNFVDVARDRFERQDDGPESISHPYGNVELLSARSG